jgi:hypothetical protein
VFVCFMALIAPTFLITRISAIKAIRFTWSTDLRKMHVAMITAKILKKSRF